METYFTGTESSSQATVCGDSHRPGIASPIDALEAKSEDHGGRLAEDSGGMRIIRNFTPAWFAVTMGTGIVGQLFHNLPYNGVWLHYSSILFFVLNVVLFTLFTVVSVLRYTLYPETWTAMIRHPTQSLSLGTFPMGFATIVNMFVFVCVPGWGPWAVTMAWAMWWVDVVVAVAICFYIPFVIMDVHQVVLSSMTSAWLLPIVATVVASASGGIVAEVLPNPTHALWTVITSYILWGTGVPLAMAILVIYFQRLTVHHLPPREVIVSVFLPLGPLGQGGFSIMQLGKVSLSVFPQTGTLSPAAGEILYVLGFATALVMWGFGLVWFFFALASISRSRFPFNMGWWSFIFPIGVYATATVTFGSEMPSPFFDILGTIFSVAVVILWIVVAIGTVRKTITGELLSTPCRATLKTESQQSPRPSEDV